MSILNKIFGDAIKKYLKKLEPMVEKINSLEKDFEKFFNVDLKEKTKEFKERLRHGETLNNLLPEAFASVREAAKRTLSQRHFDCQLMGGIVLHQGKIAEMKTGEGKTLTATLPLYLNALEGKGCHLVTVNDYLARRDTVWMGQIFHLLGLSVGCLNHEQSFLYDPEYKKPDEEKEKIRDELGGFKIVEDFLRPCSRRDAYLADITYGTNHEFGFDYLRDNMVYPVRGYKGDAKTQRDQTYNGVYDLIPQVQRGFRYAIIDEVDFLLIDEARTPLIISAPAEKAAEEYYYFAQVAEKLKKEEDYLIDEKQRALEWTEKGEEKAVEILKRDPWADGDFRTIHKLGNAIKAKELFILDEDYVIENGEIIIVDEFTGRKMPGRRWSGGIHQAVEAKAHIKEDSRVETKAESVTLASITFQNLFRMYKKLAGMTGTAATSAEEFEKVYKLEVVCISTNKPMIRVNLPDKIFKTEKGKFQAVIGEIRERYERGQPVLVGTRSIEKNEYLGKLLARERIPHQILNAKNHQREGEIIAQAGKLKAETVATNMAGRGVDIILGGNPQDPEEAKKVIELGGLHVIGTERHEARRIDNQLRGRAGRQGDPGSSQFFASLEDDLMRIFGGDKIKSMMETLKIPEDEPIESKFVSRVIDDAQARVEGFHFDARFNLLKYDDVMNKHREIFYKKRREFLESTLPELKEKILEILQKTGYSKDEFEKKETEIGTEKFLEAIRFLCLRILDFHWISHLEEMEFLRDRVSLRAYGQRDPLVEYQNEGFKMFQNLLLTIESEITQTIFKIQTVKETPAPTNVIQIGRPSESHYEGEKKIKVGRNDPCPCGKKNPATGKPVKYKKCCFPKYG